MGQPDAGQQQSVPAIVSQVKAGWLLRHPLLSSFALFFVMLPLAFILLWQQHQKVIEAERFQLLQQLSRYSATLEGVVRTAVVVTEALRAEIRLNPHQPLSALDARLDMLLADFPLFRHIAIAPDLVIRYVYPLAGNEAALNVDYRDLPDQVAAIEQTVRQRQTLLAGPVQLVQGGTGLIIRSPVLLAEQHLWGVIAAVMPLDKLIQVAGIPQLQQRYFVGLSGVDGKAENPAIFWGDAVLEGLPAVHTVVNVPAGQWHLRAFPKQTVSWFHPDLQLWWGLLLALVSGVTVASYSLLRLASLRQQALQAVAYQASCDPLTGLANRAVLLAQLETRLARDPAQQIIVLSLDLDQFKQINESLGHLVGDRLLRQVAARLQQMTDAPALLSRSGGDEFVLLYAGGVEMPVLEQRCQAILQLFHEPFWQDERVLSISTSIGVAVYPQDGQSAVDLLKHSERAMYEAKQLGRNNFYFYDSRMQQQADRFVQLHHEILRGIEQRQFYLVYQPILTVDNQRYHKCEALVRWLHPERGLISPMEFIPVAERTGAMRPLGQWILQQAISDMKLFGQLGLELQVSVNRSSQEFNQARVADDWLAWLQQEGLQPQQLIIEITESLFMDKVTVQQANVERLHQQGVQLAIDDFGTGYSALNYLNRYPVNYIKIDKSFIQNVAVQEKDRALVSVLIDMAKVLDIAVVAEGVETAEQFAILKQLQCDFVQGYYFAKPMARTDFIQFLQHQEQKNNDNTAL